MRLVQRQVNNKRLAMRDCSKNVVTEKMVINEWMRQ